MILDTIKLVFIIVIVILLLLELFHSIILKPSKITHQSSLLLLMPRGRGNRPIFVLVPLQLVVLLPVLVGAWIRRPSPSVSLPGHSVLGALIFCRIVLLLLPKLIDDLCKQVLCIDFLLLGAEAENLIDPSFST